MSAFSAYNEDEKLQFSNNIRLTKGSAWALTNGVLKSVSITNEQEKTAIRILFVLTIFLSDTNFYTTPFKSCGKILHMMRSAHMPADAEAFARPECFCQLAIFDEENEEAHMNACILSALGDMYAATRKR
jgi:hypothetical protein